MTQPGAIVSMVLEIDKLQTLNPAQSHRISVQAAQVNGSFVPCPPGFSASPDQAHVTMALHPDAIASGWTITRVGPYYDGGQATIISLDEDPTTTPLTQWTGTNSPPLIENSTAIETPSTSAMVYVESGSLANWAMITVHCRRISGGLPEAFSEWVAIRFTKS